MPLGTITVSDKSRDSARVLYADLISLVGDDTYTAGGTTGFDATFKTAVGDNREVIGVMSLDCAGYEMKYLEANGGTLKMYEEGADGSAADEVGNGDYSSVALNLLVLSK
jgi:hypothetical protein